MELQRESENAAMSLSLLDAVETHTDKPISRRFDIGMQDFMADAVFLQENRPSLSLKRKRTSTDLPEPSSSKHFKRDTALQPIQMNSELRFNFSRDFGSYDGMTKHN